ncbi:MAG: hypothetical protein HQM09_08515 [Candidatus Riflebacteria bacterium]|nr:hypothetical protein [Candidatus Riflebacteria bacterium]
MTTEPKRDMASKSISGVLPAGERRCFKDFLEAYLETQSEENFILLQMHVARRFRTFLRQHPNFRQLFSRLEKGSIQDTADIGDDGSADAFGNVWAEILNVSRAADATGRKQADILLLWVRGKLNDNSDGYLETIFRTFCIREQRTLEGNEFSNLQNDIRKALKLLVNKNKVFENNNYYRGCEKEATGRGNSDMVDRQVVKALPIEFRQDRETKPYQNLEQSILDFLTAELHRHREWKTGVLATVFGKHLGIRPQLESMDKNDDEGNPDSSLEHEVSGKLQADTCLSDSVSDANNSEVEQAWAEESLAFIDNSDLKQVQSIHVGLLWLCRTNPEIMGKTGIDSALFREITEVQDGLAWIAKILNLGKAAILSNNDGKSAKGITHYRNEYFGKFIKRRLEEAVRRELLPGPAVTRLIHMLVKRYPFPQTMSGRPSEVSHV